MKGLSNKLFRTSRKTKLNGSMLPRGGLFARAFTTVMTAMACLDPTTGATGMANRCTLNQTNSLSMEFLLDSSAGRNLISKKHLPEETHEMFSKAPEKLTFSTGGGTRSGTQAVRLKGDCSGENVFYSLKECPPALSIGIQVNEHKHPWVWFPVKADRVQDVTFFCPESAKIYADRVEENVPVLRESVVCSALPAFGSSQKPEAATLKATPAEKASSSSDPAPEALRRVAKERERRASEEVPSGVPVDVPPERASAERPKDSEGSSGDRRLRLKPDPSLPRFGEDDELVQCEPAKAGEADEPLDEEDVERHPWTPSLRERLVEEATSLRHQLTHYPKNRYCEVCRRAKLTAKVHRSRKADEDPEETPPLHYGHWLKADHIILGHDNTKGSEGEQACLVDLDEYSGVFGAFSQTSRLTDQNIAALQKFGGTRAHGKALCVVKSDAAPELTEAVEFLGWLPDPGVPNDPFHNSQLERAIRTIKEGTRACHLKAGFPHNLWPRSSEYFCTARSFSEPAPIHANDTPETQEFKEGKTCYEVANKGEPFSGYKIPLGALVYYKPPGHRDLPAFDPRTYPGIFCGWRLDSGYKFRGVHLVLDYESLRKDGKGCGRPIQVYASELVVPETFVFPLYEAM